MRQQTLSSAFRQRLHDAALLWLLGGGTLLLTTLVPLHTELLGWTPAFWLAGAPLIILLGLEPSLLRVWLTPRRPRRRAPHHSVWH
ncbi:MAG: hypothetical protein EPN49_01405 [Rhodanobacter sp.]|nr:MAG: hypothetical protein EPN49_01405 [Rhodanobacter sp.]